MADATTDCIFCRIANGEFGTVFVAESENAVAFRDLSPQAPTHVLVIPRQHIAALRDLGGAEAGLAAELLQLATKVAEADDLMGSGYRVIVNDGTDAGQTVFHLHFHVLGGENLGALRC